MNQALPEASSLRFLAKGASNFTDIEHRLQEVLSQLRQSRDSTRTGESLTRVRLLLAEADGFLLEETGEP